MECGQKKWLLLRKHVFIVEKYCKEHFSGKIPAKYKISDILSVALEDREESINVDNLKRVKSKGTRSIKGLLEKEGISFPEPE